MSTDTLTLFTEDAAGRFHPADGWTSKAAARTAGPRVGSARYRILERLTLAHRLGRPGRTAFELGAELNLLAHVAGTRLGELEAAELVKPTGERRPTDTGRTAVVYTATEAGRAAYKAAHDTMAPRVTDTPVAAASRPPGRPAGPRRMSRRGLTRPLDRVLEVIVEATANPVTIGITDAEVAAAVGILRTAAGTYRLELERAGLAERTTRTRHTDRGHPATIHIATASGILELRRLAGA